MDDSVLELKGMVMALFAKIMLLEFQVISLKIQLTPEQQAAAEKAFKSCLEANGIKYERSN